MVANKDDAAKVACTGACAQRQRHERERAAREAAGVETVEDLQRFCPVYFPPCAHCGRRFCARRSTTRFCGQTCREAAGLARLLARYATDPAVRERSIAHAQARRATRLGLGSKRMLLSALAERDGWTCQLCRQPLDPATTVKALKPSLDHVVPLSRGGSHDLSNVQLAHYACNLSKGNRSAPSAAMVQRVAELLAA
jgi:5-methylcytosine-specific restriction endonuclease McrA